MSFDIFNNDAFSLRTMTDAINKRPFQPGRIGAMGLFAESGIDTLTAQIEEKEGILYLVPAKPRGAPPTQNRAEGRKLRPINAVHLPTEDKVMADEVQGVRAFGSETQLETIQGKVNEKLTTMSQSLEATLEHMRVGGVKGIIMDADGTTPLINLFTTFEITAYDTVVFDLEHNDEDLGAIRTACHGIQRNIEDALGASTYDHVHAFIGSSFMDQLVSHPETKKAYDRWNDGAALRESWARRMFPFAGVMFEEYRGAVGGVQFFGAEEARFFPVGVPGLFRMVFSPANFIETVNTTGRPMYAKTVTDPAGRWVELLAQSNPIPYCVRPKVLIPGVANT